MCLRQTVGYDYCNKKYRHPEPNSCAAVLKEFDQCGGKSKCSDFGCQDAPWPGACCPHGTKCHRQDAFYYQCLSPYDVQKLKEQQQAADIADGVDLQAEPDGDRPASGLQARSSEGPDRVTRPRSSGPPSKRQTSDKPSQNQSSTSSSSSSSSSADAPGPTPESVTIYTKLKINSEYDQLVASPQKVSQFKSDVVGWLKSATGSPEFVQDAGRCLGSAAWPIVYMPSPANLVCMECGCGLNCMGRTCFAKSEHCIPSHPYHHALAGSHTHIIMY